MAQPAEAKAAPTWGAPCRMSRIVKSAAPARPSNHTVIWIFRGAFMRSPRQFERAREDAPIPNASRSTLSSVRSAQETLRRRLRLFDAHQNRFANKGHVRSQDHASSQRFARNQTKRQPKNAENDCRQYVRQKMCAQSDTAESNQGDQQCRASDCQPPPVARLHDWENKKSELPVKQRRSNRVATGKTVAGPIHKRAINKGPLPMNKNLHPLVQQHSTRNGDHQCDQRT